MGYHAILVLLALLPVINLEPGVSPEIPIWDLGLPGYPRETVRRIYADYEGSSCPAQAVEKLLGDGLDTAIQNHWRAMLRFVGEFGPKYADLLQLRMERTDRREAAAIIVQAVDLGGAGGRAIRVSDRRPVLVQLDCSLAEIEANWMYSIILHELYHALGLGHAVPGHDLELMSYGLAHYPTSLVALALWELWFSGRRYSEEAVFRLPEGFPYVLLVPYEATVAELQSEITSLKGQITSLRRQNNDLKNQLDALWWENTQLNSTIQGLRNDLVIVRGELEAANARAEALSRDLEASRRENEALRAEVERLTGVSQGLERLLAEKGREAEELRSSLAERERQVASLAAKVAELQKELERSEAWGQAMFFMLVAVAPVAIIVSAAVVALRGRNGKR